MRFVRLMLAALLLALTGMGCQPASSSSRGDTDGSLPPVKPVGAEGVPGSKGNATLE
jgi:hypothetical protein